MSLAGNCHLFHTDMPLVVIFAQANRASSRTAIPITAKHGRSISKNRVSERGLLEMNQLLLQGVNSNLMTCISIPAIFSFQSFADALWCCPVGDGACSAPTESSRSCCRVSGELLPLSPGPLVPMLVASLPGETQSMQELMLAKCRKLELGCERVGELVEGQRPGSLHHVTSA